MAAFEEDLGITLFIRNGKKISLTDEGILLKRRALEILNLEERTLEELKGKEEPTEKLRGIATLSKYRHPKHGAGCQEDDGSPQPS